MIVDVSAFVGAYPYRHLPGVSVDHLLREMDRVGVDEAWVGHLPSAFHRDPAAGNDELLTALAAFDRLHPTPTVHPGMPGWESDLAKAVDAGAPAVRVYPMHQALDPSGGEMSELKMRVGDAAVSLVLTVRFEDLRQRHPHDTVPDLPAAAVRALARVAPGRLVVTHAGRDLIEEVHFGLTEPERSGVLWDITWLWGPPFDELAGLIRRIGADRFVFGSAVPLRIPEATVAKLDLSGLTVEERLLIESGNLVS